MDLPVLQHLTRCASSFHRLTCTPRRPELLRWSLERYPEGGAGLEVRVSLGGVVFTGILQPSGGGGTSAPTRRLPAAYAAQAGGAAAAAAAAREGGGGGGDAAAARDVAPAVSGVTSERDNGHQQATPAGTGALSLAVPGGGPTSRALGGTAAGAGWGQEGESRPDSQAQDERRVAAEARFQQLEAEGAPPGTKCTLCHGTDTGEHSASCSGPGWWVAVCCCCRLARLAHVPWLRDLFARWLVSPTLPPIHPIAPPQT